MAGAALLDKDPYTYQKERDAFLKELWQFHHSRGTAYPHIPKIGGKEVDLFLLHSKVIVLGGWDKVNDSEQWEELLEYFNIPRACTNAASALKNISLRYLYVYQKVQAGDDPDVRQFEADEESSRKRKRNPQHSVPMRYNHRQHTVTDSMRQAAGLCMDINAGHDYVKLERSLLSGLPNEVDFALNVCTLLSNEGRRTIQLATCPQVVQLMLAHVGVFQESKPGAEGSSYQMLYETGWKPYSKRNFFRFWLDSVEDKEIRDLISPSSLCVDKRGETVNSAEPITMEVAPAEKETTQQPEQNEVQSDHSESLSEILNLNRELGLHDVEGQRVMQMAMIIRNLSFDEHNMETLASNLCVFRFLQLCIHSRYASLRQLGLDTLGSICRKMKLDPIDYRTTQLILRTITRCISSQDKFEVTRGLEMLANLSLVADNMYTLSESLEQWVYEDIVHMLLVHDIQLIVHTLETLYQLSELGETTATHIAEVRAAIAILVDLTTVEAQSYGPNSLLGIKVVEHVPPPTPQQLALAQHRNHQPHQHHSSPHHHPGSPHRPSTHTPQIARAQAPIPVHQIHQVSSLQATPQSSHTPRVGSTQVAQPTPAQPPPPPVPPHQQQAAQPQLKHPKMDAEALACNWLQSYIEVSLQGVMTRVELYAEYLGTCGRLDIRNVINTNSFTNCVRVTFPKVDSTKVEKADGSAEIHYRGLKRRDVALPFPSLSNRLGLSIQPKTSVQLPQSQTSPTKGSLIQQQLSSPPQSRHAPPSSLPGVNSAAAQRGPSYPIIQQALLHKGEGSSPLSPPPNQQQFPGSPSSPGLRAGSTPDSNLIKSLLANKVTANMHRTHQQQQQQQQLPQTATTQQQNSTQMLVQTQSPYTSQQSLPSQAPGHTGTVKAELASGHNQTGQRQPHPPQGPAQPLQTSVKPSASPAPQIAISEGSTGATQQPPSPRSKLKMTLVAKSAAAAGMVQGAQSAQQQVDNTETLSTQTEGQPKAESPTTKPSLLEACIERVQNTYVQKLEEDIGKQNEVDLKDSHNSQGVICTTAPEAHELRSEESAVKPELVSNDKTNGLGANGMYNAQESESHTNSTNSSSSISQQMMNGNADNKQQLDQPQLDTKDIKKSALTESDKLLTPEEIEKRKQEEVAQLLERNKDQVLGLNGIINHVGNGECVIPPYLKGPIPKEIINPDRISGLSLSSHQFKQQMLQQQQQQSLQTDQKPLIVENGYSTSQDNNHQEQDSKTNTNIPSDLGRSVIGSGPVSNSNTSVISNPEHTLKQEDQGQLNINSAGNTGNAKDVLLNSAGKLADNPTHKTETPMEVDTADATVRGSNGPGLADRTASQVAVDDNKAVGSLTIADMLKQHEVETPTLSTQSVQGAKTGQPEVVLPGLSVSHSAGLPAALPAAGFMSQLSTISTVVSATPQSTVSCAVNRPTVLATSVQTNPQLAKISSEQQGNVQSPTLANLPTPGDLASQMKSAMQQPAVISIAPTTQTVQATAIMQQLQQPMPQQQQQQQQPQPQAQLVLQPQAPQQQQTPAVASNFAAHMQQLQQRLQMPPQVTWPLTSQNQQTIPIATVAPQQPQPQQAQPQVLTQAPQLQQALLQQQPQPLQPSIKSQLMQRLQQPLVPARPLLQPQIPGQQQASQAPILLQSQSQPGQQQQQPILLQQQTGVNGQVHQVVVSSNLVMSAAQQTPQVVQPATLGQTVTLVQSQRQPIQVMSTSHGQQVQVMSNTGQALQVVNSQGQPIQVIQGQGQQIQVVAGQGQQLIQGQQVQVMQGGLQVRGQQVQVMPGQCVQMVNGQPQVMQFQVQSGQQIVFQTQGGSTQRPIQPALPQQQQQQQQQVVQPGQVKPAQVLLPRPAQSATSTQQVIIVSQTTSGTTTTGAQPIQVQTSQSQLQKPQQQLQQQPQLQQTTPQQQPLQQQQPPQQQQLQIQTTQQPQVAVEQPHVSPVVTAVAKRPSTAPVSGDGNPAVKKSRPGVTDSTGMQALPTATTAAAQKGDYLCDWAGCKQCFETQKACSTHVVKNHFDGALDRGFCLWEGCDKLKRQRWSLITHIQDRHLTEHALRTAHVKRQAAAAAAATAGTSAGTAAAPPPVYPQDAALQAIRRFAPHQPYPEFMQKQGAGGQQNPPNQPHRIHTRSKHPPIPPFEEPKEGPVTKHIRLTSGLILRNIAKFSDKGRQLLLKHEKHLAEIALSSVEASTAVSHCLWELRHGLSSSSEDSAQTEKH